MNNDAHPFGSNSSSDLGLAAISGGGTGTLLVYLAQNLPPNNPYKSWFIIIAPSASVVITSFWVWIAAEVNKRRREKRKQKAIAETMENLRQKIADPETPKSQKRKYQQRLDILDEKDFQLSLRIIDE